MTAEQKMPGGGRLRRSRRSFHNAKHEAAAGDYKPTSLPEQNLLSFSSAKRQQRTYYSFRFQSGSSIRPQIPPPGRRPTFPPGEPPMTNPDPQPEPPMPLSDFLTRVAVHFCQWEEDFQDYAQDYMDETEARERQQTLDEITALSAAADYWSRRCPASQSRTKERHPSTNTIANKK